MSLPELTDQGNVDANGTVISSQDPRAQISKVCLFRLVSNRSEDSGGNTISDVWAGEYALPCRQQLQRPESKLLNPLGPRDSPFGSWRQH